MRKIAAIGAALCILLGTSSFLHCGEFSERAVAFRLGSSTFNLTLLHAISPGGVQQWTLSGDAPGVGSFSQSVDPKALKINFRGGKASIKTQVTTSLGTTVQIDVTWTATVDVGKSTSSPLARSGLLESNSKPAKATGYIGDFYFIGAAGEITQRKIIP